MDDLKVLKLVSGEDIIAIVENKPKSKQVVLRGALKIIKEYNKKQGGHQIFLTDWIPGTEETCHKIPKDKILVIANPSKELEGHYYDLILATMEDDIEEIDPREILNRNRRKMLESFQFDKEKDKQ